MIRMAYGLGLRQPCNSYTLSLKRSPTGRPEGQEMDCEGTWQDLPVPNEGDPEDLWGRICDGCGELMIVIKGRGFNFPPGFGTQDAVRSAFAQRSLG